MFFTVLGYDRKNKEYYSLGYTDDKKKCLNYYIENGWKKRDIKFEERKG